MFNRFLFKRFKHYATLLLYAGYSLFSYVCADTGSYSIASAYHWGRGLDLPGGVFNIGGYFNSTFQHIESQKDTASLDDLSLFISASPTDRLRFFSELELQELISTEGGTHFNAALNVERLYIDFLATETASLRLGKFLTPVGRWNVIHAAPLVWTASRPLVTEEQLFPSRASGMMLTKTLEINEQDLDISVYFDDSADLDPLREEIDFDNAFGGRLNYTVFEQFQIGASYLNFKNKASVHQTRNQLFGLDLLLKKNGYELQSELIYRNADDFQGDEKGFYIQGVAPLGHRLFAVARYEYLDGTHQVGSKFVQGTTNLGITGLTWRPYVPLAVKAEYRFGSDNEIVAPSGFFTSISMFF